MLTIKLPQLLSVHQMPRVFWEDGILSGYRHPKSSALDCLLSSFQMTNETVNIWTHFLPTWYFLWRFLLLSYTLDFFGQSYNWPLLVYMMLICLYPFTSSFAHTFSSMSAHARHICYFLDYGALSLYSLGCAFTYGAYVLPDRWVNGPLHRVFVPVAAFNTFICTGLSCYSRFLEVERPHLSKFLRTVAFVHPFVFDNIPLFFRLLLCFGDGCTWNEAVPLHLYHLFFALLTGFLFASHLPERLAPGRFDYFGHSHQLFHVCAVLGTHFQMEAVLCDRSSREAWLTLHSQPDSLSSTLGVVATSVIGNIILICFFTATLLWSPRANSILQSHVPGDPKCKDH
ncbi:membrane progestin receptor delta isoform X2 [Spea bombifrons]|uniref:membrane progestin receptor delta isoform X2 n=1 Tax=Spea bombifrons TaxID=233779 RepID=UPI00234B7FA2|nr:membrane progestin receptor delta isoform X2 [Spea bombifrons]